jgi:hypothetical protein
MAKFTKKRKYIIITLDLITNRNVTLQSQYYWLNLVMKSYDFEKISPRKKIHMPHNTYITELKGKIDVNKLIRDISSELLLDYGIKVKRLFGGVLDDYSLIIKK